MAPDPETPTKKPRLTGEQVKQAMNEFISKARLEWSLRLKMPEEQTSKREELDPTKEEKCVIIIKYLCWRALDCTTWEIFNAQAIDIYNGRHLWPHISNIDDKSKPRTISAKQKIELLDCLHRVLKQESEKAKILYPDTPSSRRTLTTPQKEIDDRPVYFSIPDSKRIREDTTEDSSTKKAKQACSKTQLPRSKSSNDASFSSIGGAGQNFVRSANTSFSSVFDVPSRVASTQASSLDGACDEDPFSASQQMSHPENIQSSYYGSSPKPDDIEDPSTRESLGLGQRQTLEEQVSQQLSDELLADTVDHESQNHGHISEIFIDTQEKELKDHLQAIFPRLPSSLCHVPWPIIYEITRVCLYAGVSPAEFKYSKQPFFDQYDGEQYNKLYQFLRDHPLLKGKPVPERSSAEAWNSAFTGIDKGFNGIVLSGFLQFGDTPTSPFKFRLRPIKLDQTHRLDRSLGSDRFLEIDIPLLTGYQLPKYLASLRSEGPRIIVEWLVDGIHDLFGRTWKPFFTTKLKKKKNKDPLQSSETGNRLYFFAVDGKGIEVCKNSFHERGPGHYTMSISNLLDFILPMRKNGHQSFLKLFSRISLALSRNRATILLKRAQIIDKDDIPCELYPDHPMTDGAGRMSKSLAEKIAERLGLTDLPSGFQGRIGEAKGFWIIDYSDKSDSIWLETYESQRKWKRSKKPNGESEDESHRTFEVVGHSGPLKSKSLNKQIIPLLMDRARDKQAMKRALQTLVQESLASEVKALQVAMETPQLFRKWLYEMKSNISERLKASQVPYRAALPQSTEERLNMLLDSGFHPQNQLFVKDLARKLFKFKSDDIVEKLKITVPKSASVYMVPDFYKVLKPNEVYINFSKFGGESFGILGNDLFGQEILVTRSPAHFPSDIQKVTVVEKVELMSLKDVIVFSTKDSESLSLAGKLSGGDYDGDRAWICWEPTLVNNFGDNAGVPECENLVDLGYIHKDRRTYGLLVKGRTDPTSFFLKKSFAFGMQENLLGKCTEHKDAVCYTQDSVNQPEAIWLSNLLSSLVDQAKQGLTFTEEDWKRFKNDRVKILTKPVAYKQRELDWNSSHILDRLKCLTSTTVNECLTELHESIKDPPFWDEHLAKQYNWAKEMAATNDEWKTLIKHLEAELVPLKLRWARYWAKHKPKEWWGEPTGDFYAILDECYESFQQIRPHVDNPFTQVLLPKYGDPGQSEWALLKASALFCMYPKDSTEVPLFPWLMGGIQLARLKGKYGGFSRTHPVVASMYAASKPDGPYISRSMSGNQGDIPDEDGGMALEESSEGE
ncbi:hypothetical protein N431DRAFT_563500 [Stipitochalara longipes BDJ]|nr:hypothetical protein N431DRAFT_563500 [Stipitochalara longipes BDJ]